MTIGGAALGAKVLAGDRRALAKAITLVESTRPDHRTEARALLDAVAGAGDALRVGITGTPGVGKSTVLERLGLMRAAAGRVAVLAIDPSSTRSGGAILGDKTRMPGLARHPAAIIRPSPSGATLGGVARRTREVLALVEAWGAQTVFVETVGVGQSETLVADMTDVFVLLMAPGGGDELQGVKRGIMEVADLIVVNKADGDLAAAAQRTAADYAGALRLLRRRPGDPEGYPCAMTASALTGAGLDRAWAAIAALDADRRASGARDARRATQRSAWFEAALADGLARRLAADPIAAATRAAQARAVAEGRVAPEAAAERVLDTAFGSAAPAAQSRLDDPAAAR